MVFAPFFVFFVPFAFSRLSVGSALDVQHTLHAAQ
jgi:hypothetical protein